MDCEHLRDAISARLDDEDPGIEPAALDAHLARCASCARWATQIEQLHRAVRVQAADPVPDLTEPILARAPQPAAPVGRGWAALGGRVSGARWALLTVALTQLVLAGPALLLGEDPGAAAHVARELGAFDVAIAVGLLVAASQPARAWGLLPVAGVLGLVMGLAAVLDVVDGTTTVAEEAPHLLHLAGVGLLWLVARQARDADRRLGAARLTTA